MSTRLHARRGEAPDVQAPDVHTPAVQVDFALRVVAWQAVHGRHDLPWQASPDPYRIWVSEIMLQQTQVAAVIPYYHRFMDRFPDVAALASAALDEVLAHWSGLGYYARARNMHRAAGEVIARFQGRFPTSASDLETLPGIGRSTAAAIAAFSCGERAAILDGNVKRVLARHFLVEGYPGSASVQAQLWTLATALLPEQQVAAYTQGLMDLGATLCTRSRPRCSECPVAASCGAHQTGRVAEFPQARPRRARPERTGQAWLLRRGELLLLERRPPSGVWGGLWSLPEALPNWAGNATPTGRAWQLRHVFTHFALELSIEERRLDANPARAARPDHAALGLSPDGSLYVEENGQHAWFTLAATRDLGLPAPIRVLLEQIATPAVGLLPAALPDRPPLVG